MVHEPSQPPPHRLASATATTTDLHPAVLCLGCPGIKGARARAPVCAFAFCCLPSPAPAPAPPPPSSSEIHNTINASPPSHPPLQRDYRTAPHCINPPSRFQTCRRVLPTYHPHGLGVWADASATLSLSRCATWRALLVCRSRLDADCAARRAADILNQNSRGVKRERSPDTYQAPPPGSAGDDGML